MTYEKGKEILVKDLVGNLVKGIVDDYVFESASYWVTVHGTFRLFTVSDLDQWNTPCVCGSDAVSHPGHAYYCAKKVI